MIGNRRLKAKRAVLALQKVAKILQKKRQVPDHCFGKIAETSDKEHNLDGKPVQRKIFYLRSIGCTWAQKRDGGCLMCGHYAGTAKGKKVSAASFITQFRNEFEKYDYGEFPVVAIYNAGSFLGDEIPIEAQVEILDLIGAEPKIEMVIFESRPELITDEALTLIREKLVDRRVQIGIGFETVDDEIRELSINKGATLSDYDRAFERMKRYDIEILTYILMKPAFISERTAIDDTIRSIEYALNAGITSVSIEPISIQDDTVIDLLHREGVYRTPWIWSFFEVLKATHHLGEVRAGGFEFFPTPREFVHNCPKCDDVCYNALREYNETYSVNHFETIECDCDIEWKKELESLDSRDYYGCICEDAAAVFAYAIDNYVLSVN